MPCDTKTIESLAAGVTTNVTFTVSDILEAGKTASYYVQVANQVQDDVTVSFLEEPVLDVYDLAITTVQGCIYLDLETNYVTVFVENKGNVDIVDATVTLTAGDKVIGTGLVSARAGEERNTGFCSVEVDTEGLVSGDLEVTATVTVEGEAAEKSLKEAQAAREAAEKAAAEAASQTGESETQKPEDESAKEGKKTNMAPILIIIVLMAAAGGGWFFIQTKKKKKAADAPDPDADYTDEDDEDS